MIRRAVALIVLGCLMPFALPAVASADTIVRLGEAWSR